MKFNIEGISVGLDPGKNELMIHISDEPVVIKITSADTNAIAICMAAHIIKPTIKHNIIHKETEVKREKKRSYTKIRRPTPDVSGPDLIKRRSDAILNFMRKVKLGVSTAEINKALDVGTSSSVLSMRHLLSTKQIFRSQSSPCFTRYGLSQKIAQDASDSCRMSR
jgi:hypothetical protein